MTRKMGGAGAVGSLVSRVLIKPGDVAATSKLLQLLYEGEDISVLRSLFRSSDPDVVEVGTWIASETGWLAAPIINDIAALLPFADRGVTFNVLDCLTSCSNAARLEDIVLGLDQLKSVDSAIIWKAQRFLWSLPVELIQAALAFVREHREFEGHLPGLELIEQTHLRAVPEEIEKALSSSFALLRAYAVVCAVAISGRHDELMLLSLSSTDEVVREFAESVIKIRSKSAGLN